MTASFKYPFTRPVIPPVDAWAGFLKESYERRYFTNFGPVEQRFAGELQTVFGRPGEACVLCSNATAGLTAALVALDVRGPVAAPSFSELLRNQRASSATQELRNALDFTRETAVHNGQSISIAATNGDWAAGWEVFVDPGNRGTRDAQHPPLTVHGPSPGMTLRTDSTSRRYIHFTPRGNAIHQHRARPTLPQATAVFGAVEGQVVAQHVQQRGAGQGALWQGTRLAIDDNREY